MRGRENKGGTTEIILRDVVPNILLHRYLNRFIANKHSTSVALTKSTFSRKRLMH